MNKSDRKFDANAPAENDNGALNRTEMAELRAMLEYEGRNDTVTCTCRGNFIRVSECLCWPRDAEQSDADQYAPDEREHAQNERHCAPDERQYVADGSQYAYERPEAIYTVICNSRQEGTNAIFVTSWDVTEDGKVTNGFSRFVENGVASSTPFPAAINLPEIIEQFVFPETHKRF
jgi:hypothetical protein